MLYCPPFAFGSLTRFALSLRQQLLTTIYYIVFHYPLDMSHYTVSIVYKRWMTEAVRDGEFSVEDDVRLFLLLSPPLTFF